MKHKPGLSVRTARINVHITVVYIVMNGCSVNLPSYSPDNHQNQPTKQPINLHKYMLISGEDKTYLDAVFPLKFHEVTKHLGMFCQLSTC